MEKKLFSVIVLHHNQPDYWQDAISSVLMQDYPAIEMIFADDGSKNLDLDAIKAYVEENKKDNLKRCYFQINEINGGTCRNCNSGIEHCTGDYILMLDGDDALYNEQVITNFVNAFDSLSQDELIVTARAGMYDITLEKKYGEFITSSVGAECNALTAQEQYQMLHYKFVFGTASTAFRREIFDVCGVYDDENYILSQDGYYFIHITRLGHKFNFFDFCALKHREGGVCNPVAGEVSPGMIKVVQDLYTVAVREILPYLDTFTPENANGVLKAYGDNYSVLKRAGGYKLLTENEIKAMCPIAYKRYYSKLARAQINANANTASANSKDICNTGKLAFMWLILLALQIVLTTLGINNSVFMQSFLTGLNIVILLGILYNIFKVVYNKLVLTAFSAKTAINKRN